MKNAVKIALIAAHFALAGVCQAASISLSPSPQDAVVGGNLSFDVIVDFTGAATIGGGFSISYDSSILGLSSFAYAPVPLGVDMIPWEPVSTATAGTISGIGFEVDSVAFAGSRILATLNFTALSLGAYNIGLSESIEFMTADGLSFIDVSYSGATGQIAAVPVPAALWLLASGLSMLGLSLRRRA